MIRSVESLNSVVVGAEPGTPIQETIEIIEKKMECKVQSLHQIDRGAALDLISGQRLLFHIANGPLGTGIPSTEVSYFLITYLKDETAQFANIIKQAQKDAEKKAKEREEQILKVEADEAVKKAEELIRQSELAKKAAEEALAKAGIKSPPKAVKEEKTE